MKDLALNIGNDLPSVLLEPVAVQLLGRAAKLDQEVAGQVLGRELAPLFLPEANERRLTLAHDDPGVGAAYE